MSSYDQPFHLEIISYPDLMKEHEEFMKESDLDETFLTERDPMEGRMHLKTTPKATEWYGLKNLYSEQPIINVMREGGHSKLIATAMLMRNNAPKNRNGSILSFYKKKYKPSKFFQLYSVKETDNTFNTVDDYSLLDVSRRTRGEENQEPEPKPKLKKSKHSKANYKPATLESILKAKSGARNNMLKQSDENLLVENSFEANPTPTKLEKSPTKSKYIGNRMGGDRKSVDRKKDLVSFSTNSLASVLSKVGTRKPAAANNRTCMDDSNSLLLDNTATEFSRKSDIFEGSTRYHHRSRVSEANITSGSDKKITRKRLDFMPLPKGTERRLRMEDDNEDAGFERTTKISRDVSMEMAIPSSSNKHLPPKPIRQKITIPIPQTKPRDVVKKSNNFPMIQNVFKNAKK